MASLKGFPAPSVSRHLKIAHLFMHHKRDYAAAINHFKLAQKLDRLNEEAIAGLRDCSLNIVMVMIMITTIIIVVMIMITIIIFIIIIIIIIIMIIIIIIIIIITIQVNIPSLSVFHYHSSQPTLPPS